MNARTALWVLPVVALMCSSAMASYATDYLSSDASVVSHIEDFDWEILIIDVDNDGVVDDGDIFLGVFEAEKIIAEAGNPLTTYTPDPAAGDVNFTAVFANKVANKDYDGSTYDWDFVTLTDSEWALVQAAVASLGDDTVPDRQSSDSQILVYSDDTPSSTGWVDPSSDIPQTVANASDGTLMYEFGVTDGDEIWHASSKDDTIATLTVIDNLGWYAGLNVTYTSSLAPDLIDHDYIGLGTDYELELSGGSIGTDVGPWLQTNTSLWVKAIPEPASILVWTCLLGLVGGIALRKRCEE